MLRKRPAEDSDPGDTTGKHAWSPSQPTTSTILVGAEETKFVAEADVLKKCPFFEKCLKSGFIKCRERLTHFPADDAIGFAIVFYRLQPDALPGGTSQKHDKTRVTANSIAFRDEIIELENALVDDYRAKFRQHFFDVKGILLTFSISAPIIWNDTDDGCWLRALTIDTLRYDIAVHRAH